MSGGGSIIGDVVANSGTISPGPNATMNIQRLTLNSAAPSMLGSLVHIDINANGVYSDDVDH